MMEQDTMNIAPIEAPTPGAILKQARETLHLTHRDVANKTHLSVQTIKDMEADNYKHVKASIYVRGYLRSISRAVKVAEDQTLAAYDAMNVPQEPSLEERATAAAANGNFSLPVYTQSMSKRKLFLRWATVTIAVVLIMMVVFWWRGQTDNSNTALTLQNQTNQQQMPLATDNSTDLNAHNTVQPSIVVAATSALNTDTFTAKAANSQAEKTNRMRTGSAKQALKPTYTIVPIRR